MKALFLTLLAIILPFMIFFFRDEPSKGLLAMGLQGSVVGWPIATIWAISTVFSKPEPKK